MQEPSEGLVNRLRAWKERAEALQDVTRQAAAVQAGPAEARDRSGSVTVRLAADGLPESIQVHRNRSTAVRASPLDAAVMEAAHLAGAARMAAWSQGLQDRGIFQKTVPASQPNRQDGPAGISFSAATAGSQMPPRSLGVIAEEVLSRADLQTSHTTGPAKSVVEAVDGKVALEFNSHALLACRLDHDWAERQSDRTVNAALADALSRGRQAITAAGAGAGTAGNPQEGELQSLGFELLRMLQNLGGNE